MKCYNVTFTFCVHRCSRYPLTGTLLSHWDLSACQTNTKLPNLSEKTCEKNNHWFCPQIWYLNVNTNQSKCCWIPSIIYMLWRIAIRKIYSLFSVFPFFSLFTYFTCPFAYSPDLQVRLWITKFIKVISPNSNKWITVHVSNSFDCYIGTPYVGVEMCDENQKYSRNQ